MAKKSHTSLPVGPHSKVHFSPRMKRAKRTQYLWGVSLLAGAAMVAVMGYTVFLGPFLLAGVLSVVLAFCMGRGLSEMLRWALGLTMLGVIVWVLLGLSFLGGGPAPLDAVRTIVGGL